MIKIICLVLCIAAASLSYVSANTEGTALRKTLAECYEKYGVNDEQLEIAKKSKSIEHLQPCFLGCSLKKINLIDNDGRYTPENGLPALAQFLSSEEDLTKFTDAAQNCLKVNDQQVSGDVDCERAKLVVECAIEHNLEIPI